MVKWVCSTNILDAWLQLFAVFTLTASGQHKSNWAIKNKHKQSFLNWPLKYNWKSKDKENNSQTGFKFDSSITSENW